MGEEELGQDLDYTCPLSLTPSPPSGECQIVTSLSRVCVEIIINGRQSKYCSLSHPLLHCDYNFTVGASKCQERPPPTSHVTQSIRGNCIKDRPNSNSAQTFIQNYVLVRQANK